MHGAKRFLHFQGLFIFFRKSEGVSQYHFTIVSKKSVLFLHIQSINPLPTAPFDYLYCQIDVKNCLLMNRLFINCPLTASKFTLHLIFLSLCSYIYTYFIHMCSLYRGFCCHRDQKKCSLFRVERCSLYRGAFPAKIGRGDRDKCSNKRCSLYRGFH